MLGHVHLAVRAHDSGRSAGAVTFALAGSLAGDAVLVDRLLRPVYRPGLRQWVAQAVDTGLWSVMVTRPTSLAAPLSVNAQPSMVEAGYHAGTARTDVPAAGPGCGEGGSRGWPPPSLGDAVRLAVGVAAPLASSAGTGILVRRVQGLAWNPADLVWSVGLGAAGFLTARHRSRLQQRARETWAEACRSRVEHHVRAAVAELVTAPSPAHDFTKTLLVLEDAGSRTAGELARRHLARPGELVAGGSGGRPLGHVIRREPVDPPDAGRLWLAPGEIVAVERFLALLPTTAAGDVLAGIRVAVEADGGIRLSGRGRELVLRPEPPDYRARLYPTSSIFVLSAAMRTSDLLPVFRSLPRAALFGAIACDLMGAVRFWRRPPGDEDVPLLVALVVAGCGVGLLGAASKSATTTNADGEAHLAGISIVQGAGLVLAAHWGMLRGGRLVLPFALAAFAAASRMRMRPSALLWVESFALIGQSIGSMWRLGDLVDCESATFHASLQDTFAHLRAEARQEALAEELARFESELATALVALDEVGDTLDISTRRLVEDECRAVRLWLDDQQRLLGRTT